MPRDLTVVGFDDTLIAATIWPELTTIQQPIARMASRRLRRSSRRGPDPGARTNATPPDEEARILARQCLKARGEPEDVASLVLFPASEDARMCTAHECFVEAGLR